MSHPHPHIHTTNKRPRQAPGSAGGGRECIRPALSLGSFSLPHPREKSICLKLQIPRMAAGDWETELNVYAMQFVLPNISHPGSPEFDRGIL